MIPVVLEHCFDGNITGQAVARAVQQELKAEKEKALLAAELEAAAREHELKMAVWVNNPLQIKLVSLTLLEILD